MPSGYNHFFDDILVIFYSYMVTGKSLVSENTCKIPSGQFKSV